MHTFYQLGRNETGLLEGAATAAIEDPMPLDIGCLDPTGIHEHRQLAVFAAGIEGGHHEGSEGHPRQASVVSYRQNLMERAHAQSAGFQWVEGLES